VTIATNNDHLTPAGQRILDVASRLFYEQGIRAVGVDMIAREAGVTKKTIYDRFGSKDALIERYLKTRDSIWHGLIEEHVEREDLDPRGRLLAMFDILEFQKRDRGCAFINAHAEFTDSDQQAFALTRNQKTWMRDYFRDLAQAAGAADPDSLGTQLLLLHEGTFVAYAMAGEEHAPRHAREAAEILVDAALAKR
jgi:AcrR family transcriptional regulator